MSRPLTLQDLVKSFYRHARKIPSGFDPVYLEGHIGIFLGTYGKPPLPHLDRVEVISGICKQIRKAFAAKTKKTLAIKERTRKRLADSIRQGSLI